MSDATSVDNFTLFAYTASPIKTKPTGMQFQSTQRRNEIFHIVRAREDETLRPTAHIKFVFPGYKSGRRGGKLLSTVKRRNEAREKE